MCEKIHEMRKDTVAAQKFFMQYLAYTLGPAELKKFTEKGGIKIVDVRNREDFNISHIPSAISIPKDELDKNLDMLSKDEITIIYCYNQQCHLGAKACLILADYAYPCMLLEGGFKSWVDDFRFATVSEN